MCHKQARRTADGKRERRQKRIDEARSPCDKIACNAVAYRIDEGEKKQSTSFSNIKNLTPQGRPIPLLYGKMLTSLVLISQGIETFDDMIDTKDQTKKNSRPFFFGN